MNIKIVHYVAAIEIVYGTNDWAVSIKHDLNNGILFGQYRPNPLIDHGIARSLTSYIK